nr:MAG TPA: alpha-aminoadipate carrier protein [Caudoviricetes sp.]
MKLTCIKCGTVWAVSDKHSKIGPYVCPVCTAKKRKGAELKNKKG